MNITPDKMNEAEIMAKHFQHTRKLVMEKKGMTCKPWPLLPVKEKQILVDTFVIILGAADAEQGKKPLKRARDETFEQL